MNDSELLFNGRYLRLRRRQGWEYAERTNPGGAVIILATTPDEEVLFVEQYRIPVQARTIEMPAGLVGDLGAAADEALLDAARRELLEETGYEAGRWQFVMAGPSSAGLSNEMMAFVLAEDLRQVGPGGGDASERITLHRVPLAEASRWVTARMREGYAIDPKVYAGLYFLRFDLDGQPRRR